MQLAGKAAGRELNGIQSMFVTFTPKLQYTSFIIFFLLNLLTLLHICQLSTYVRGGPLWIPTGSCCYAPHFIFHHSLWLWVRSSAESVRARNLCMFLSSDGGKTVHADIPELNEAMAEACKQLGLCGHRVKDKVIYGPVQIGS